MTRRTEREPAPGVAAGVVLSRHVAAYGFANVLSACLALVNAIVLTRLLEPGEYGTVGLAMVSASFVTLALNAPIASAAFARSFGGTDEGDDDEEVRGVKKLSGEEARRSFGSALSATAGAGLALAVLVGAGALLAFGTRELTAVVALATVSGALGSLWRLLSTVPRLRRRPRLYVGLSTLRPLLVLGASVILVTSGAGALGAVAGVAIGSLGAVAVAGLVSRDVFTRAFDGGEVRWMMRKSRRYFPLIAGFWLILSADLYLVAAFASAAQVGEYRLASRLGAVAAYGASAVTSAWNPLENSSAFRAADKVHGRDVVRGQLLFFFLLFVLF
ncbi:MAG TPA: hypothetical protein VF587_16535, partial [Solirubrobacteraceae bacterium]